MSSQKNFKNIIINVEFLPFAISLTNCHLLFNIIDALDLNIGLESC